MIRSYNPITLVLEELDDELDEDDDRFLLFFLSFWDRDRDFESEDERVRGISKYLK